MMKTLVFLTLLLVNISMVLSQTCVAPPTRNYCEVSQIRLNNFNQTSHNCLTANSNPLSVQSADFFDSLHNCSYVFQQTSSSCQEAYATLICSIGCNSCTPGTIVCPSVCSDIQTICTEISTTQCYKSATSFCINNSPCSHVPSVSSMFTSSATTIAWSSALGIISVFCTLLLVIA